MACTPRHDAPLKTSNSTETVKTTMSFQKIRDEILKPNCVSCHTGRHNAYENYQVVKLAAQNILIRVTSTSSSNVMPPSSLNKPLSTEQIDQLREWIEAGAPEFATDDGNSDNTVDTQQPPEEFVGFNQIKEKLFKPKCIGCHSHYNDYNVVKRDLGSIVSAISTQKMPYAKRPNKPVEPLEDSLNQLLTQWVNQGAPFSQAMPDGPNEDTLELKPTWISLRNNIFGPKCIQCHNAYGPRAPTKMDTFFELRKWHNKSPKLFDFNDPENSHFIGSMRGRVNPDNDEFFFDPMPFNSKADDVPTDLAPVSDEEIEVIKEWIKLQLPYK
jgi:cytochrome c553